MKILYRAFSYILFICFGLTTNAIAQGVISQNDYHCSVDHKNRLRVERTIEILVPDHKTAEKVQFTVFHNDMVELKKLSVKLIDRDNETVKSFDEDDFLDLPITGSAFYNTNRIIPIQVNHHTFPYSIRLTYTTTSKSFFYFPVWVPQHQFQFQVLHSSYTISADVNFPIESGFFNFKPHYTTDTNGTVVNHTWTSGPIAPIFYEEYSTPGDWRVAKGLFSPTHFKYADIPGSFESWKAFGQWIYDIGETRQTLPDAEVVRLQKLTAGADDLEKIKLLYQDLQSNNRYVNITIKDGGFVPFDAQFVCEKRFGDCKALSNYLKASLDAVGIESFYTLVNAGNGAEPVDTSIHTTQFNHVFLMVPLNADTIWLECTSNALPMNYLGTFTEDRFVLICKDSASRIVRTPTSQAQDNQTNSRFYITEVETGYTVEGTMNYTGLNAEQDFMAKNGMSKRKFSQYTERLNYTNLKDATLQINSAEDRVEANRKVTGLLTNQVQTYGNTIMIEQFHALLDLDVYEYEVRLGPIWIPHNELLTDTSTYSVSSAGPYALPKASKISSEFGEFSFHVMPSEHEITIVKTLKWNKGVYSRDKFSDFFTFISDIESAENQSITFKTR